MGGVLGLDFTAIFTLAAARRVDPRLLADVLPSIEPFIIFAWSSPPP